MKTTQAGDLAPLGYVMAVPICYCKPGKSALVKKRIEDKALNFKNISFTIDRYVVSNSKVATETFTADGTTTSFVVDELIHEEDILVKEGTTLCLLDRESQQTTIYHQHISQQMAHLDQQIMN